MKRIHWPGLVLSLIGAVLGGLLLVQHAGGASSGFLAAVCGGEGAGCDAVINSRWGVFPPGLQEGESETKGAADNRPTEAPPASSEAQSPAPADRSGGIPVAALGLFYFSTLLVWFAAIGRPGWRRRWMHTAVQGVCVLGCLGSIWFIIVMFAFIETVCPLCLGSHVANFALLGSVFVLRPRAPAEADAKGALEEAGSYPQTRPAVLAVLLALAVCAAEWKGYQELRGRTESGEATAALQEFMKDVETLRVLYLNQEKVELGIEDDDPMIKNEKIPRMTLAYFSDLECPHCAKFDTFLFEEIIPRFNGHLRIVFKHYPLQGRHPNAFKAATAAEAAHLQGKFWEAHDYLIERRKQLKQLSYTKMATDLGIDPLQLIQDMNSPRIKARVKADIALARKVGLRSTPSVFLNSRKVSRVLRRYTGFWNERSEALRETAPKTW